MIMKRVWLALAAVVGLMASAVPAAADLQFTLNTDSSGGNVINNAGPFGTITLHQVTANQVQVKVNLATGVYFANTGAGYALAWDISGNPPLAINLGSYAGSFAVQANPTFKASPFTSGANGHKFQYAIDYTAKTNSNHNALIFDITTTGALALTSFIGNPIYRFTADIIAGGRTRNVASIGDPVYVPEPGTELMFVAGMLGLVMLRRRKLAQSAA
jgi:hypothetical protein